MDGIVIRVDLVDDPHVLAIARTCGIDVDSTVGKLYRVWRLAELHGEGDTIRLIDLAGIDHLVGVVGFGAAMETVGWLRQAEGGVRLPGYDQAGTESPAGPYKPPPGPKPTKASTLRMRRYRARKAAEASHVTPERHSGRHGVTDSVTCDPSPRMGDDGDECSSSDNQEKSSSSNGASQRHSVTCDADRLLEAFYLDRGGRPPGRSKDSELAEALAAELGLEAALGALRDVVQRADAYYQAKGSPRGPAVYFSATSSFWQPVVAGRRKLATKRAERSQQAIDAEVERHRRLEAERQANDRKRRAKERWASLPESERAAMLASIVAARPALATLPQSTAEQAAIAALAAREAPSDPGDRTSNRTAPARSLAGL